MKTILPEILRSNPDITEEEIETATLQIVSEDGQIEVISKMSTVNLACFPEGTYFIRLLTDKKTKPLGTFIK